MEMVYLNSNDGSALAGLGCREKLTIYPGELMKLSAFMQANKSNWIFLALSYDIKNEFHPLQSNNSDSLGFPLALLFVPETVVEIKDNAISKVHGELTAEMSKALTEMQWNSAEHSKIPPLHPRTSKDDYLQHVSELKKELQYGNIYEINYCQEFLANDVIIDNEAALYQNLNKLTQTPFSAYFKIDEFSAFCASPERFLKKTGDRLISQPIKGTIRRGSNSQEDDVLKKQMQNDPKERSENVMIVDLVRNDLSQIATKGSVQVDELFGIYSFKTVHQMISSISCTLKPDLEFIDVLRATFPMGSMTGAPKRKAMELIEEHEDFKRGLYSGSIGYVDPLGNFDLNVVIRSLIYNRQTKTLSCSVGSAITIDAIPEKEYEECLLKINSFLQKLTSES
jgi:para-aminobenzoate synthetase component 1